MRSSQPLAVGSSRGCLGKQSRNCTVDAKIAISCNRSDAMRLSYSILPLPDALLVFGSVKSPSQDNDQRTITTKSSADNTCKNYAPDVRAPIWDLGAGKNLPMLPPHRTRTRLQELANGHHQEQTQEHTLLFAHGDLALRGVAQHTSRNYNLLK